MKEAEAWGVPIEDPNPLAKTDCIQLEHRGAEIVSKIQRHGFKINREKVIALCATLAARRQALEGELAIAFPPKVVKTVFAPRRTKVQEMPFNPGSRQVIADRFVTLGWKPSEYGKDGTPTVDDEILQSLQYAAEIGRELAHWHDLNVAPYGGARSRQSVNLLTGRAGGEGLAGRLVGFIAFRSPQVSEPSEALRQP